MQNRRSFLKSLSAIAAGVGIGVSTEDRQVNELLELLAVPNRENTFYLDHKDMVELPDEHVKIEGGRITRVRLGKFTFRALEFDSLTRRWLIELEASG